jgi:hypothetical protein
MKKVTYPLMCFAFLFAFNSGAAGEFNPNQQIKQREQQIQQIQQINNTLRKRQRQIQQSMEKTERGLVDKKQQAPKSSSSTEKTIDIPKNSNYTSWSSDTENQTSPAADAAMVDRIASSPNLTARPEDETR